MAKAASVDINRASAQELDAVPCLEGHGFEIVRYREERGVFTDLRQLGEARRSQDRSSRMHRSPSECPLRAHDASFNCGLEALVDDQECLVSIIADP